MTTLPQTRDFLVSPQRSSGDSATCELRQLQVPRQVLVRQDFPTGVKGEVMREDDMLQLGLESARLAVQGKEYGSVLAAGAESLLRADAGVGFTTMRLNDATDGKDGLVEVSVVVSGIPPLDADAIEAATRVVPQHPVVGGLAYRHTPHTERVSDQICLPQFWDTETWRAMHDYGTGGRYPAAAVFGLHHNTLTFLGVHRRRRDFSDEDMEILDILAYGPLAAALAFRSAWDRANARLKQFQEAKDHNELTQRETQVLGLVALGWTNRHVGHTLGITERTVRKHLENINDKLGVSNRTAAVYACRRDLA